MLSTVYVDVDAAGADDGSSWSDAYADLQDALSSASSGDDIWVAEGIYVPTDGSSRGISFSLLDGVGVYGGFDGTETARGDRDWVANETILSGDLDGDDGADFANNDENSYHVVTVPIRDTNGAVLDGFTISGGNADGTGSNTIGGGIWAYGSTFTLANSVLASNYAESGGGLFAEENTLVLTNVSVIGNEALNVGGGVYSTLDAASFEDVTVESNEAGSSGGGMVLSSGTATIKRVAFVSNAADSTGGGLYLSSEDPTMVNVVFDSNTAGTHGGGIYAYNADPEIVNTVFLDNEATGDGGAMASFSSSAPDVINSTFSGNDAGDDGGAIYNDNSALTMANSIVWGNTATDQGAGILNVNSGTSTVTYSDIQDGHAGTGNINSDPSFRSSSDLRLASGSPAIDAANNSAVPTDGLDLDEDSNTAESVPLDLGTIGRFTDDTDTTDTGSGTSPIVDMGAYEYTTILYVDANPAGGSWAWTFADLQDALAYAVSGDQIWVAEGTYKPVGENGSRNTAFDLVNGVELYGGFDGAETSLAQRDWASNVTTLSGDVDSDGSNDSYSVVKSSSCDATGAFSGACTTAGRTRRSPTCCSTTTRRLTAGPWRTSRCRTRSSPTASSCPTPPPPAAARYTPR